MIAEPNGYTIRVQYSTRNHSLTCLSFILFIISCSHCPYNVAAEHRTDEDRVVTTQRYTFFTSQSQTNHHYQHHGRLGYSRGRRIRRRMHLDGMSRIIEARRPDAHSQGLT